MRLGLSGELIAQQLHGRYYESTYRGAMFSGGNTSQVVTTVGFALTYTGLCLTNPIGSGINLVMNKVSAAFTVVWPAVAIVGIMTGFNGGTAVTQTTPLTVSGNLVGRAPAVGLLASSVTLPTAPTLRTVLGAGLTGAATVQTFQSALYDLEGSIIIPPGGYACIYTSAVSGAAGFAGSFQWEEVLP
jgi:hypothetical protein